MVDLACGQREPDQASVNACDCRQFRVLADLVLADQIALWSSGRLIFDRGLVAALCAPRASRVDHHRLRNGGLGNSSVLRPSEEILITPAFPAIIASLVRAIPLGYIAQQQPTRIEEFHCAQHPPVINPRHSMGTGNNGLELRHLRARQSRGCSSVSFVAASEARRRLRINVS